VIKNKPKICVVATTPLSVHFFFKPHIKSLLEIAEVTLILNPENDAYVPDFSLPVSHIPVKIMRPISPLADLRALIDLFAIFRRERFDLVWATAPKAGLLGMIAAGLAGVPLRIFVFQGEVWASKRGAGRWLLRLVDKITAFCATNLLVVSDSEKKFLENQGVIAHGKAVVLGKGSISGVDLARYQSSQTVKDETRATLGIPEDSTVLLFVGRIVADKGIFELVEAFKLAARERPDLWFLIVGPDESGLERVILESLGCLQYKVRFVGFSTQPEKFMVASDFICLPSYREGFGMVIIEAGALGIPAIGSRIYGISDAIIDGKTGELVEVGNVKSLYQAICRFADDKELRFRLGAAAKAYVLHNFSCDDVVGRYQGYFKNILNGVGRKG
jgi:glycosyltransferase involved in cell wall biosynthesis